MSRVLKFLPFVVAVLMLQSCAEENAEPDVPGSDRDKFTGTWLCRETFAGSAPTTFTIEITKHGSVDTLYVSNFSNIGASFNALWLIAENSVTIPPQTISQTTFSGTGFYNDGEISLTYTSDGDGVTAKCTR